MIVSGINVDVVRKNIKNLHLGVYPPLGRVRVATPLHINDEAVRLFIISRLTWIKRQRAKFESQERQSAREFLTGESHYYQGQRYLLDVSYQAGTASREYTQQQHYGSARATRQLYSRAGSASCSRGTVASSKSKSRP